jgi:hypothetical protein
MNSQELKAEFASLGVPRNAHSVGADADEAYCLVHENDKWIVYYSERGRRNSAMAFADEAHACQELFWRVTQDGTVQDEMKH